MSDDSFIREVEEELRSDRIRAVWQRYGRLILVAAVALVVAVAGYRYWQYHTASQAAASGDRFIEAVELSSQGKHEEAITKLEALGESGSGEYPALARIRLAAEHARNGDADKAVAAFDEIAGDSAFDTTLRDVARLRAGMLLVDHGTYEQVADRLEQMAGETNAFRHSAREGLGLSAWKTNRLDVSRNWFETILQDEAAPQGIRARANIMLELLAGRGA